MKDPLVTIAITAFNGALLISRAIESSLHQTYPNLEILVLDDASTDSTETVVSKFRTKDRRVVYVRNDKNIGYSRSLQKLGELAHGEYIQLLGADDWLSRNYVETVLRKFEAHPKTACVASKIIMLGETGGNHFGFLDLFMPDSHLITREQYIRDVYKTASILPTLTAYALYRRGDFLESIRFMNEAFDDPAAAIPQALRELHLRGFATESLFLLKVIRKYGHFVLTDKTAYVKVEYAVQDKKPYSSKGLDWASAGRILRWFYFTRLAYERVFETDYKEYFHRFRTYFGSELLVSVAIVFVRKKAKRGFLDDLKSEDLKAYYEGYSLSDMIASVLFLPLLFSSRLASFLGRISRKRDEENAIERSDLFLDVGGFFRTEYDSR